MVVQSEIAEADMAVHRENRYKHKLAMRYHLKEDLKHQDSMGCSLVTYIVEINSIPF